MHTPARLVLLFAVLIILVSGQTLGQTQPAKSEPCWGRFRGPGGLGIASGAKLPVVWSTEKNVLWKVPMPGAGASSPIVVGSRVFVTCYSGYHVPGIPGGSLEGLKRHVLCLNLADGKILWQQDFPAVQPETKYVGEHGYAASTPASDGERLYVFFGKSGVFALDLDGKKLWQADVGSNIHDWGSAASPVIYKDLVIVNASVESESLVALDKKTGKGAWRAPGIRMAWNTPLLADVGGKTELVIGVEGNLLGINPDSGRTLWKCAGMKSYMCPSPVAAGGAAWALWGRRTIGVRLGGRDDVSGSHQLWNFWRSGNAGSNVSSPIYLDGKLYFASESNGSVYCMDAQTGAIVYDQKLDPAPGKIYASPVLADGKLYYVSRSNGVYVVEAKSEFKLLAHNDLGDKSIFDGSPAVAGNRMLLRSDRFVYCVGERP
jgi:hypothetical protein